MVFQVKNAEEFNAKLKEAEGKLVVVDFFATWCGPCTQIAPKMEELSKEYTDVVFLKVDVDELEELTTLYNISCMPTFLFFKNSTKVKLLN
ncbi:unnamed protein product [Notodromas monacha]|uniref:Thioredoxin domain-containing protein n=1 Tax=Notodromas monacha TaxID=399045 RepID=A0A7R9BV75_9CRUS|nr:unnamed protein product [Notodromas monacha]CAG0922345.1 unnamed protein product [Notodromas monacha]